ncbi:MAG: beta-galactosidase, partial [Lachnospiraceae bacterium]|nr:beta-galactosidase [Lachnospiraceae bacterium]
EELCDTFLDTEGFAKGCAFINGFNLGRFWEIGPQKRLYIPAPLLKKGRNTIILFETEGKVSDEITLRATPDLGFSL